MNSILKKLLQRFVRRGDLVVIAPDGSKVRLGDRTGPELAMRFRTRRAEWAVLIDPDLRLGEAIMDGSVAIEQGSMYEVLELLLSSIALRSMPLGGMTERFRHLTRRWRQRNTHRRARSNVAHHYDLDGRLYDLFLDSDRQYSCAYFETPETDLEEAQLAKKRHVAAKLRLQPGQSVLDIGSGWGGLGLYIADLGDADVTGVTLSTEQQALSTARANERGLSDRAHFLLKDYRTLDRTFDRIVSVGMFEHVGIGHYDEFFGKARDLLADDGVMVLHSIGRFGPPGATSRWIDKYIFPGGYIPSLSEVLPVIERHGLYVTDVEILRLHYADTLRAWRERFLARRAEAAELYDERFCRMWEYYLVCSELAFRLGWMMNFQIQMTKSLTALPLTRDYMLHAEEDLRRHERPEAPLRVACE